MNQRAPTLEDLFGHAHEITSPLERKAYLDAACADLPQLREQVEALLRAHDEAGSFLEHPISPVPETDGTPGSTGNPGDSSQVPPDTDVHVPRTDLDEEFEGPGSKIGPYLLLEKLGEGGMGTVYRAEQEAPLRRQVALKIIKAGMDSAQVVARFEKERQALALMDHDAIARVYDAGTTRLGRPFFVMELVQGAALTRYCDQHTMTIEERLPLFVSVCQAIQHAHQKGVIHRDIKPSNVLVQDQDGKPVVKVIDFGLAKAVEQPLTEGSASLASGGIVGTLEYMSPEQANFHGKGVDTRTDVYSLGVMLYELLTGTTTLDRKPGSDEGLLEVLARIQNEVPPRPSQRAAALGERETKVAGRRKVTPGRLPRLLRGDLDTIAMKAVEKDREVRYQSASDLGRDVQRYLANEPVEARPKSWRYRLGKLILKYPVVTALGMGLVISLILAVVGTTIGLVRATNAETWTTRTLGISNGINLLLARNSSGTIKEDDKAPLRKALAEYKTVLALPNRSQGFQRTAAETHFQLATLAALLGEDEDARKGYNDAIAAYEKLIEQNDLQHHRGELARCHFDLGVLHTRKGEWKFAEKEYRQALEIQKRLSEEDPEAPEYRSELADTWNNLGTCYREQRRLDEALTAFRQASSLGEKLIDDRKDLMRYRSKLGANYHNLGNILRDQGKVKEALAEYARAIATLETIGDPAPDARKFLRNAHWDRGTTLVLLGNHEKALSDWVKALQFEPVTDRDNLQAFRTAALGEQMLGKQTAPTGPMLFEVAFSNAQAATAAKSAGEPLQEQLYSRRALSLLEQARGKGLFREPKWANQLQANPAFRKLPPSDFLKLLTRVAADANEKAAAGQK